MNTVVSFLLSFLILLSSSGLAYAKHFCGPFEVVSKVTLGEESLSCGMKRYDPVCEDEKNENHSCCSNEYVKVNTDDHFNKTVFNFEIQNVWVFIGAEVFKFEAVAHVEQKATILYYYRPPPLKEDLQILYETFLI